MQITDVKWGRYRQYEGPYYPGSVRAPDAGFGSAEETKQIAVIAATEGGRLDAINAYDRMIISGGLIQWAEAGIYGLSALLGQIKTRCPDAAQPLKAMCAKRSVDLVENIYVSGPNKWRFVDPRTHEIIDTLDEQRKLFLHHSDGTIGSWDNESRMWAKEWAMAVALTLSPPSAQKVQIEFTARRLQGFVMGKAKEMFQGPATSNCHAAARAAYLSFAANLPAIAAKHFGKFLEESAQDEYSPAWLGSMLLELTFGPGITIYPTRYNAIRPVLERLYEIDLPDFADELREFAENEPAVNPAYPVRTAGEIQTVLLALGYDLGPKGADGVIGEKTKAAIRDFQRRNGLREDGIVGPRTRAVLVSRITSR